MSSPSKSGFSWSTIHANNLANHQTHRPSSTTTIPSNDLNNSRSPINPSSRQRLVDPKDGGASLGWKNWNPQDAAKPPISKSTTTATVVSTTKISSNTISQNSQITKVEKDVDNLVASMTSLSTNDKSPVPNLESQIPNKIEILTSLTFDNPLETNEKVHITEHITSSPKVSAPPPKEAEKSDWATIMNEEPEDKVLLEFYEFTRPDCKEALSGVLSQYRIPRDKYEVRWVDKSRAIGKFENEHIATQAKEALGPTGLFKIRRYSGTFDIKDPVYPPQFHRPLTTNSVARRLIHGALGLRAPVRTKEERERDHNLLRIAREEKEARIHPRIHHGLVDNRSM